MEKPCFFPASVIFPALALDNLLQNVKTIRKQSMLPMHGANRAATTYGSAGTDDSAGFKKCGPFSSIQSFTYDTVGCRKPRPRCRAAITGAQRPTGKNAGNPETLDVAHPPAAHFSMHSWFFAQSPFFRI
jgi:hypothetical protein